MSVKKFILFINTSEMRIIRQKAKNNYTIFYIRTDGG